MDDDPQLPSSAGPPSSTVPAGGPAAEPGPTGFPTGRQAPRVAGEPTPAAAPAAPHGPGRDVGGAVAATVAGSLAVFLVGALGVQLQQSLHFGPAALGAAVSICYVGAALGSVPFGRLAEAVGGARVLRLAALAAAGLLGALALAARSWALLAGLLFLAGLVSSAIQPAANLFLARRTPPGQQGLAFGVKQAAVPLAAVIGGFAVPVVALTVGWRWAFVLAAAGSLVAAVAVPHPRISLAEHRARPAALLPTGSRRALVTLAIGLGLGVFAATGLTAFIVSAAVHAGISQAAAGWLAALGGLVAGAARVVSGWRADRRGRSHLPVAAAMLATGGVGYAVLVVGSARGEAVLLVVGVVVTYGAGWGWNGLFNFAIVRTHPEAPARATSVTQVGGRLAGALGPFTFGLVAAHGSYADAWAVAGSAALVGAGLMLVGRRLLVRRRRTLATT